MKYSEIAESIDIDAFYNAIGFQVLDSDDDNDRGYCFDFWGLHQNGDTTGKLSFHRDKKVFNCWVCGGGSLLSFAMEYLERETGIQHGPTRATEWLNQFATNRPKTDNEFIDQIKEILKERDKPKPDPLPWFNTNRLKKWKLTDEAYDWLDKQYIPFDAINAYDLAFDPKHRRANKRGELYEGPAIIIPHFWKGKLVGWQERWMNENRPKWVPKYTNTMSFPKDETLYGLDGLKSVDHAAFDGGVMVTESTTTVLRAYPDYIGVSTFGSSVTEGQLKLLRQFETGVLLVPDNDKAGEKWARTLTEYLETYIPVYVVDNKDVPEKSNIFDTDLEIKWRSPSIKALSKPK